MAGQGRVLADFTGKWRLDRQIAHAGGQTARLEGAALWHPEDGGLCLRESGTLLLAGQPPLRAERRYFWAADLRVYFEDGRFFHQVPRHGGQALHRCAPDTYVGQYDFTDWPEFRVTWQVQGPRKAYRMQTRYRPFP